MYVGVILCKFAGSFLLTYFILLYTLNLKHSSFYTKISGRFLQFITEIYTQFNANVLIKAIIPTMMPLEGN